MNINRGITNITITTKRRDVLFKRTKSDEANQNCVLVTTYGAPKSRCCTPAQKPAAKPTVKVTRRNFLEVAAGSTRQSLERCWSDKVVSSYKVLICSDVLLAFVDYEKAFGHVKRIGLRYIKG